MRIKESDLRSVLNEYIDEVFAGLAQDWWNVGNKLGAKIILGRQLDKYLPMFTDKDGYIDLTNVEEYTMPEIRKMGVLDVPGIGKNYSFNENDFLRLFAKLKGKAND
jgi:hypothetical protein